MAAAPSALIFPPTLHCPFCSHKLPTEAEKVVEVAQDHFITVHKAISTSIPEKTTEPLQVELGLSAASSSGKSKNVILVLARRDLLCVSLTRIERYNEGPKLSTVVYRIYGDPGLVTIATPSFNIVHTCVALCTNVNFENTIRSSHSAFCCSYEDNPEEFILKGEEKMSMKLNIYFGHQVISPTNRLNTLKRCGASIALL